MADQSSGPGGSTYPSPLIAEPTSAERASNILSTSTERQGGVNLNLTDQEKKLFGQIFSQADPGKTGLFTGDAATKLPQQTLLPETVLSEVSISELMAASSS